ncbi:hypothetical protein A33M_4334 [Rhodovulum sp. PH10]|uniref:DUF2934 domain-containing protein n=1 Tax=Rhodovulum sp. PH10 TaxID=1187851 RepID=UPI00027C2D3C|nr:DUF2934 domain-containing protein [Rhodovulum sp. PH10]EJW10497.1 hypothetical protein A33M_4334 [Rhodovulum sp. PH10]
MAQTLEDRIRERAYHIWLAHGCAHGQDDQYWLQAEREILAETAATAAVGKPVSPAPEMVAEKPAPAPAVAAAAEAPEAAAETPKAPAKAPAKKKASRLAAKAKAKAAERADSGKKAGKAATTAKTAAPAPAGNVTPITAARTLAADTAEKPRLRAVR